MEDHATSNHGESGAPGVTTASTSPTLPSGPRLVPPREENFLGIIFNSFLGYKTNSFIFRFEIAAQQIRAFFPLARQIRASFAVAQQIRAVAGVFFCSPTD